MECLECNQQFKAISNSHLKKCCGLTLQEYSLKHNIDVSTLLNHNKIEEIKKCIMTKRKKQINNLTYDEKQIIIGSLLGDGYIFRSSQKIIGSSTYLILEQGIDQINYLLWKGLKLQRLGAKFYQYYKYSKVRKRVVTRNQVRTESLFLIGDMISYIYSDSGKYINTDVIKYLDAPGVAIWFMDDGSLGSKRKDQPGYSLRICSLNFNYEDHVVLKNAIKGCFDINTKIGAYNRNGIPYYYISFNKRNSLLLKEIINEYVIPSMKYKLNIAK